MSQIINNTVKRTDETLKGSVLVIGAGISGMQSALDLAESGYKVYLVEKSPSIGGKMAKLDKTFPTNDCAMCVISPKLVDCSRHRNIEIITYADIIKLTGKIGNFKVVVNKKARSVDLSKCTGCGECSLNCPVRNTVISFPQTKKKAELNDEKKEFTDKLLGNFIDPAGDLIALLQGVNEKYNYLPRDVLEYISEKAVIPITNIIRVATFYNAFSLIPRGRNIISVCMGTACFVAGAERLLESFEKILDVKKGFTTKDKRFTLEPVRCIGCCALAPAVRIADDTYGKLTLAQIPKILEKYE